MKQIYLDDCQMSEKYIIWQYNEHDSAFGYVPPARPLFTGLEKAVAKSIVRHFHKDAKENGWYGDCYFIEAEPTRWW